MYDRAGLGFSDRGYKVSLHTTCSCVLLVTLIQNTSQVTGDYSDQAKQRDRSPPSTVERLVKQL